MTTSVEQLAELARNLGSQPTTQQTLDHAVRAALGLIDGCEWAGISVAKGDAPIQTVSATGHVPARSVEIQRELGEGPCLETTWEDNVLHLPDLAKEERWSRWVAAVRAELGVGSVLCVRLSQHQRRHEVLSLYSPTVGAFDSGDEMVALTVAAQAAVALAAVERVEQLGDALSSRTMIGQAVGLVMHRFGLTGDEAFELLRRHSNDQNRKLVLLAKEMVEEWDATKAKPEATLLPTQSRGEAAPPEE
jgi:GAF domain-containing protein